MTMQNCTVSAERMTPEVEFFPFAGKILSNFYVDGAASGWPESYVKTPLSSKIYKNTYIREGTIKSFGIENIRQ